MLLPLVVINVVTLHFATNVKTIDNIVTTSPYAELQTYMIADVLNGLDVLSGQCNPRSDIIRVMAKAMSQVVANHVGTTYDYIAEFKFVYPRRAELLVFAVLSNEEIATTIKSLSCDRNFKYFEAASEISKIVEQEIDKFIA